MAFLRVNGLEMDAMLEDFSIDDVSVENYARSAADTLEGLTFSVKKEITFKTPYLTAADAFAYEGWIRGRQHFWDFQRIDTTTNRFTLASKDAGLSFSLGTSTTTTLFGSYGLHINSSETQGTSVTTSFGSEGDWTIHFYHRQGSTGDFVSYGLCSRNGSLTTWSATGTTSTIRMMNYSVSSGYLGLTLLPKNAGGSTVTANFCGVTVARYAFTTSMFLALSSAHYGGSSVGYFRPPFVTVSGDCLPTHAKTWNGAAEKGPMICKGFLEQSNVYPVILNGVVTPSARQLTFRLTER